MGMIESAPSTQDAEFDTARASHEDRAIEGLESHAAVESGSAQGASEVPGVASAELAASAEHGAQGPEDPANAVTASLSGTDHFDRARAEGQCPCRTRGRSRRIGASGPILGGYGRGVVAQVGAVGGWGGTAAPGCASKCRPSTGDGVSVSSYRIARCVSRHRATTMTPLQSGLVQTSRSTLASASSRFWGSGYARAAAR